jgi:hypothetical protein
MAEEDKQAPRPGPTRPPRPVPDLQAALELDGWLGPAAPPAADAEMAPESGDPGKLAEGRPPRRRPVIRPRTSPVPSQSSAVGSGSLLPPSDVVPPATRPRKGTSGGTTPATSAARPIAKAADPAAPIPHDSQTSGRFPSGGVAGDARGRDDRAALGGNDRAAEPERVAPRTSACELVEDDKPNGPDYSVLAPVIAATREQTKESRRQWRQNHLPAGLEEAERQRRINDEQPLIAASPETQETYLARGKGLIRRYKRETNSWISLEDMDPRDLVEWLLGRKPLLSQGTWRNYRASAAAIVQSLPSDHMDEALATLNADRQVGSDNGGCGDRKAGVSPRAQRMDYRHFQLLKQSLSGISRGQVVDWLKDWLDAGIHTGLRPREWALTTLEKRSDPSFPNGRLWLHVVSIQAGEGPGTYRTLDLSNFTTPTREALERTVERSRHWALTGRSSARRSEISKLFSKSCETLFPRMEMHYTLYSLRQQFIANMKTIYRPGEVAALVGHIPSDTEIEQHYGKRRAAWTKEQITELPMPVKEQVARMKQRRDVFEQLRELKELKQAAARRRAR